MPHAVWVAFLTMGLFWMGVPGAQAASKYNACGLLTAAELQAAVHAGVDKSDDKDVIVQGGPYKGETMSSCTWALGASYVSLNVIRAPQTAEQKAAGLSGSPAGRGRAGPEGVDGPARRHPGRRLQRLQATRREHGSSRSPRASCRARGSRSGSARAGRRR